MISPRDTLRDWLPHLLMLLLVTLMVVVVGWVFWPILPTALVAASLAALTHGAIFNPIHRATCRLLPRLRPVWQRRGAAATATLALVVLVASPVIFLLVTTLGGVGPACTVIIGVIRHENNQITLAADIISRQLQDMRQLIPVFPEQLPQQVHTLVVETLSHSNAEAFYKYLFTGTGGLLARLVLGVIFLFACYDQGALLAQRLLNLLPLDAEQCQDLQRRFRHASLRLLNDTIAMTVAKGLALGAIASLIAGVPFSVVAAVASFVGLIPVVGYATVWLPLASYLWSQGHAGQAIGIVLASIITAWLIGYAGRRLTKTLEPHGLWMGFLLFLGLIGGLLSMGLSGLVIGPLAVVLLRVIGGFWLPLYGVGTAQPEVSTDD